LRNLRSENNVLKIHEVHETMNSVYVVTELLEGGTLNQFVNSKNYLSEVAICTIMFGIFKGLESLKRHKIAHRDLKLSNIILKRSFNIRPEDVVIVDFGLSSLFTCNDPTFKRCGTPGFIAPEVISSSSTSSGFIISLKVDIYSAGAIFYYLCARKRLFDKSENDTNVTFKKRLKSNMKNTTRVYSQVKLLP
jgi:serine/threonine protein kinase